MKRVKRFGVFQTAKVAAIIYFVLSAIFLIPFGLMLPLFTRVLPEEYGFNGFFLLFLPFFYAFFGFVSVAIACAIYNLIAGWTGGIEVEIEEMTSTSGTYAQSAPRQM